MSRGAALPGRENAPWAIVGSAPSSLSGSAGKMGACSSRHDRGKKSGCPGLSLREGVPDFPYAKPRGGQKVGVPVLHRSRWCPSLYDRPRQGEEKWVSRSFLRPEGRMTRGRLLDLLHLRCMVRQGRWGWGSVFVTSRLGEEKWVSRLVSCSSSRTGHTEEKSGCHGCPPSPGCPITQRVQLGLSGGGQKVGVPVLRYG